MMVITQKIVVCSKTTRLHVQGSITLIASNVATGFYENGYSQKNIHHFLEGTRMLKQRVI